MRKDEIKATDSVAAGVVMAMPAGDAMMVHGRFHAECVRDGKVIWTEDFDNLVTTVGKNDILDKFLKGAAYTQTIRMGLKGVGSAVAGDTQASHGAWVEQGLANAPTYTGNRKDVVMGAAAAGSSVSPTQAFAITSNATVGGCFINNGGSATKDDTTGVLFSAGDFSSSRAVINGDTLNVTYTLSV